MRHIVNPCPTLPADKLLAPFPVANLVLDAAPINDPPQFPVHKFLMRLTDGNELEAVRSKSLNYITAVAQRVPARAN
jgi:hypothetical protein